VLEGSPRFAVELAMVPAPHLGVLGALCSGRGYCHRWVLKPDAAKVWGVSSALAWFAVGS